jgi:hypothetical protein
VRTWTLALNPCWLAATLLVVGCDNECDFTGTRCNGDTVEQCGGVDQQVGRRVETFPCTEPNSACAEGADETAACVHSPATACDPDTFTPSCDGDLLLRCLLMIEHVEADDCTERDPPMRCQPDPDTTVNCH